MTLDVHRSNDLDPRRRGHAVGEHGRARISQTAQDYAWLFDAAGMDDRTVRDVSTQCLKQLESWAPPLAAEIAGVADGAGLETWQAAALNARTEILVRGSIAGLNECSVAAWLPDGQPPRSLQTWDWIPWAQDGTVRRHVSHRDIGVVTGTESGVVGKVGLNSAGLGVLFTLLCHTSDGTTPGVPVHAVARWILDTATTVAEAVEIARSAPVTASASLTVLQWADGRGEGATVEISPAGSAVLVPEDDYLLHTNHFLDPALAAGDRLAAIEDDTLPRMGELHKRKHSLAEGSRTRWAAGLICHWEDGAPLCAHPRPGASVTNRWETKMLFSLDLAAPGLVVQAGGPCRATETGWVVVEP